MMNLSECAKVNLLPYVSVRNTNTATADATYWGAWHDVRGFEKIYAKAMLGPVWNAADDLTTIKLQQSDGSTPKDLTTASATGDYDTDTPVDAAANTVVLEADVDQLDIDNGYYLVRLYAASTSNTGEDDIGGVLILHEARQAYAEREQAASSGEYAYVRPS